MQERLPVAAGNDLKAAGILAHSAAIIADAVHSLSDFLTDIYKYPCRTDKISHKSLIFVYS